MASGSLNLFDKLETYFFLSLSPLLLSPYRRFPLVSRVARYAEVLDPVFSRG